MTVDWREVALATSRRVLDAAEICGVHARQLENAGASDAAAAYRHCASMLRRLHAGEPVVDVHDVLRTSLRIFAGLSR